SCARSVRCSRRSPRRIGDPPVCSPPAAPADHRHAGSAHRMLHARATTRGPPNRVGPTRYRRRTPQSPRPPRTLTPRLRGTPPTPWATTASDPADPPPRPAHTTPASAPHAARLGPAALPATTTDHPHPTPETDARSAAHRSHPVTFRHL